MYGPIHTLDVLNIRTVLAVTGVLVLLGFLTWGLVNKGESGLAKGEPVPASTLTTLPPGGETSLADYRGEWVLMNVWASWCIPCRKESPALDEFEAKYRDKVTAGPRCQWQLRGRPEDHRRPGVVPRRPRG